MGGLAVLWAEVGTIPEVQGAEVSSPPPRRPQNVSSQRYPESSFIGVCALIPTVIEKPCLSFINILFLSSNKFPKTTFSMLGG